MPVGSAENGRGYAISSASTSIDDPGGRSRTSRAHTQVSVGCSSLVETSLSPEPDLRKMSSLPLTGASDWGACTRKNTWSFGANEEGCAATWKVERTMPAVHKIWPSLKPWGMNISVLKFMENILLLASQGSFHGLAHDTAFGAKPGSLQPRLHSLDHGAHVFRGRFLTGG